MGPPGGYIPSRLVRWVHLAGMYPLASFDGSTRRVYALSPHTLSWKHDGMAAGPHAPAAHRGARTAPTRLQGQ
eukprot:1056030-Prorocentrum_minimum.AAC.1